MNYPIPCTIIGSDHSDVAVGTKGTILGPKDNGFEVEINGNFAPADTPAKRNRETRIIFFKTSQVEVIRT